MPTSYAAAGWQTEYGLTEDEELVGHSNGNEYDCEPTTCSTTDDDPNDPVIKSVPSVARYEQPRRRFETSTLARGALRWGRRPYRHRVACPHTLGGCLAEARR